MSLISLPAELRLQIYEYLPSLATGRNDVIGPPFCQLTPAICRTCRQLRAETLSLYASGADFSMQSDNGNDDYIRLWLQALGHSGIRQLRCISLYRHWTLSRPVRGEGHVGFYVRLEKLGGNWKCTTGTYPTARDMRGMRLESVELLQQVVQNTVLRHISTPIPEALAEVDFETLLKAADIVATHPIAAHDVEQSEAGRQQRSAIWTDMQSQLLGLEGSRALPGSHRFYKPN
ncbi:Hypothetical protein R9X50_00095400 [Acrodontium crateriforme]|uniref:F-box domain-containing protein n=1 Tax=Acrodontium crateriforme TaxID=150365 RepID=A0AAQ3R5D2_9PEZI|nr:Hypothetical protein R9X50_00095400 [Acrodontium crateriforme]